MDSAEPAGKAQAVRPAASGSYARTVRDNITQPCAHPRPASPAPPRRNSTRRMIARSTTRAPTLRTGATRSETTGRKVDPIPLAPTKGREEGRRSAMAPGSTKEGQKGQAGAETTPLTLNRPLILTPIMLQTSADQPDPRRRSTASPQSADIRTPSATASVRRASQHPSAVAQYDISLWPRKQRDHSRKTGSPPKELLPHLDKELDPPSRTSPPTSPAWIERSQR